MTSATRIVETRQGPIEVCRFAAGDVPVLLHHGLVGSANLPDEWVEAARSHAIDVVSASRPGYGASPPIAMRTAGEWAGMAGDLADDAGWGSFSVVGISAGAQYAYAAAAGLGDRVAAVAALSGLPDVRDPDTMALHSEEERAYYERFAVADDEALRDELVTFFTRFVDPLPDDDPWREMIAAALTFDGAGPTREVRLQIEPWGFGLDDVLQPVRLWHHRADREVPFAAAQRTARSLPRAEVVEQVDEPEHGPSLTTVDAAFAWLADRSVR